MVLVLTGITGLASALSAFACDRLHRPHRQRDMLASERSVSGSGFGAQGRAKQSVTPNNGP
jgi:hypothetical protein